MLGVNLDISDAQISRQLIDSGLPATKLNIHKVKRILRAIAQRAAAEALRDGDWPESLARLDRLDRLDQAQVRHGKGKGR